MKWYEKIIEALTTITDKVGHGEHLKGSRYFVWQEDGTNDLYGGNRHAEKAMTGTIDLYSKTEFDPWVETLGDVLEEAGIPYYLNSIQFEPETKYWHWEWVWTV